MKTMTSPEGAVVRSTARRGVLFSALCAMIAASTVMGAPTPYPGEEFTSGTWSVWIPSGVEVVRGVLIPEINSGGAGENHDHTNMCAIWKFAVIKADYADIMTKSVSTVQSRLDGLAVASKHPEISRAPFCMFNTSRHSQRPVEMAAMFPNRAIAVCSVMPGADGGDVPKNLPFLNAHEQTTGSAPSNYAGISAMPSKHSTARAAGSLTTYVPQWGWGHGWYSVRDYCYYWFDVIIKARVPANADPRTAEVKLNDMVLSDSWLGEPATWHNVYPTIAAESKYTGNKSNAPWIPGEEAAWVWRAYSSRHPTETQQAQGEGHVGDAASTYTMQGQANVIVSSPTRPYHLAKTYGKEYPVYPVGASFSVTAKDHGLARYTNRKAMRLYDGKTLVQELPPNAYGIYNFKLTAGAAGVHALSVQVVKEDNSIATSRPALFYVQSAETYAGLVGVSGTARVLRRRHFALNPQKALILNKSSHSPHLCVPTLYVQGAFAEGAGLSDLGGRAINRAYLPDPIRPRPVQ